MNFSDLELMQRTIERINRQDPRALRVSAEHYLWLAGRHAALLAVVSVAGGTVEGHPTSTVNILQRIRALRDIERCAPTTPLRETK